MTLLLSKKGGFKESKIVLTLLNGTGYIFDVEDYLLVRKRHHIVGALVGTCANRGWSVNDCTMPVELSPLETRLLVEEGIATLVSKSQHLLKPLNDEELKKYQENLEQRINQQAESLKDEKLKESEKNIDKIMAGKRKKLLKQGVNEQDIQLNASEILREIREGIQFERKNALVDIPCGHAENHAAYLVYYSDSNDSLKYLVFRDLWRRGKFVTCGDAFGADFLIYPGDPLIYHASHIVILLYSSKIKPLDMITKVRLSVTVNKLCVFAYLDDESDSDTGSVKKIVYHTMSWESNRDKER